MSNLISSAERNSFVSGIRDHYESFTAYHTLIIIKEPLKTIVNINSQDYNNYGYQAAPDNYSLTPVSGIFSCMTYDQASWKNESFDPIPVELSKGEMIIKVQQLEKDYFENSKTELVILDNETYNVVGGPLPTNYLSQNYWYYSLERTT